MFEKTSNQPILKLRKINYFELPNDQETQKICEAQLTQFL